MNIAILDDYQTATPNLASFALLGGHDVRVYSDALRDDQKLIERLAEVEALVLIRERFPITRGLIEKLPNLKLISTTGRRRPHVDVPACTEFGIAVLQGDAGTSSATAEFVWALIMAAQRRLPQYVENLKHGRWQQSAMQSGAFPRNFGIGRALGGQTLGIWGFGNIGRVVAGYARAFEMNVLVWGREDSQAAARVQGHEVAGSRNALFERSDILTIHLPLNAETQGLITESDFARMKPSALFVNTSRAGLVQPGALAAALDRRRPGHAAVDVYETEPIGADHPLLKLENCICTPHIGYVQAEYYERLLGSAFRNLRDFCAGNTQSLVNPEAKLRYRAG